MSQESAVDRVTAALDRLGIRWQAKGGTLSAKCPAHNGKGNTSLSVRGIEGRALVCCFGGCDATLIVSALGLRLSDLFDERRGAEYQYTDRAGRPTRTVYRSPDKRFRQAGNTKVRQLFRLPKVMEAVAAGETVYLVEGEQDVLTLESLGVVATTAPEGAGRVGECDLGPLKDAVVVAIPDRDAPGEKWAAVVRERLDGFTKSLTFVEAKDGKDVTDHALYGHGLDDLVESVPRASGTPSEGTSDEAALTSGFPDDGERSPFPTPRGEEHGNTDLYADVASLLDGDLPSPPGPVLLRRTDGRAIFYAGQVNIIFGDPESGKTLVALAASSEALRHRRRVLIIDIDHNGVVAVVSRLIDMGVPEETLRDRALFRYVEPEDKEHLMAVVADARTWRPAVAVVDSVGELLPLMGLNSNSPDDFTLGHTRVLKPLALAGAAVLAIDHLPKNVESRASGPTGTAAKRRVVGGVMLRVTIQEPFAPGRGGAAILTVNKDRHGELRRYCPVEGKEPSAGVFTIEASEDEIRWRVNAPQLGEGAMAAGVKLDDLAELDRLDPEPTSVRDVKARLKWGGLRATSTLAAWRSRRSQGVPEERGTRSCLVCHGPVDPAAGDTHPSCEPEGVAA